MRAKWTEKGTVGIARRVHALFATTKSKHGAPADAGVLSERTDFVIHPERNPTLTVP